MLQWLCLNPSLKKHQYSITIRIIAFFFAIKRKKNKTKHYHERRLCPVCFIAKDLVLLQRFLCTNLAFGEISLCASMLKTLLPLNNKIQVKMDLTESVILVHYRHRNEEGPRQRGENKIVNLRRWKFATDLRGGIMERGEDWWCWEEQVGRVIFESQNS